MLAVGVGNEGFCGIPGGFSEEVTFEPRSEGQAALTKRRVRALGVRRPRERMGRREARQRLQARGRRKDRRVQGAPRIRWRMLTLVRG